MKNIFKILSAFCLGILLFSATACNFLDAQPDDLITEEMVINDIDKTNGWLAKLYDYLPDPHHGWAYNFGYNVLADDVQIPLVWSSFGWWSAAAYQGTWSASTWTMDVWGDTYRAVRQGYKFLEGAKPILDQGLSQEEVDYMKLEARFLMAYYYSVMLELYGPFPLVTSLVDANVSADELLLPRTPMDEIVEYLDEELLDLAKALPATVSAPNLNYGRATKGMALAVRARMHLFVASPLFNGNTMYAGITNPDGTAIFPQEYDKEKWKRAADATRDLLDLAETGVYELYKEYTNGKLDPFLSYQNIFFTTGDKNKELIFTNNDGDIGEADQNRAPRGSSGNGAYSTTQNLVDAYFTKNGLPIDKDPEYREDGYNSQAITYETAWNRSNPSGTPGLITVEGTPWMYCNREPRFYVSVLWHGEWYPQSKRYVDFLTNGVDGLPSYDSPPCGYLMRKRQHPESTEGTSPENHPYRPGIIFRLAEFYLNYAEALNEYYGADATMQAEALKYLNLIRERAGIPQYTGSYSQNEMREMIRNERRVELADEGKRYHDLRRWKMSASVLGKPIMGMNVNATTNDDYFRRVEFMTRAFEDKNYLWPIYQTYIDNNPNLKQNYGF